MTSRTLESVLAKHDQAVLEHLDRSVAVPIVDFGRQGDVLVIPSRIKRVHLPAEIPVPSEGVGVVRAVSGAGIHLLVGEGDVRFDPWSAVPDQHTLGTLSIGPESTAFLIHPEHGAVGFVPGDYSVSRQRELANGARFVED